MTIVFGGSKISLNNVGGSVPLWAMITLSKGEKTMNLNWDNLMNVWDEFLKFMDRVVQWLQYVFGVTDEWPPKPYPDIDADKNA